MQTALSTLPIIRRVRNVLGQQVVHGSGADGDFDGYVMQADFDVWKDNFGKLVGADGNAATAMSQVPEPVAIASMLIYLFCILLTRVPGRIIR